MPSTGLNDLDDLGDGASRDINDAFWADGDRGIDHLSGADGDRDAYSEKTLENTLADDEHRLAHDGDGEDAEELERSPLRNAVEWLVVIVGAVGLAVVVNTLLLQAFYIPSPSMEPTLVRNDRILVNKLGNHFGDPSRGEIVVFHRPDGASGGPEAPNELVKRVVGLPGETVEIRSGQVFIDGDPLEEPYLPENTVTRPRVPGAEPIVLGDDEFFMMGDNRDNSLDSRAWGPLRRDEMVGRAFVKFWPLRSFEFF